MCIVINYHGDNHFRRFFLLCQDTISKFSLDLPVHNNTFTNPFTGGLETVYLCQRPKRIATLSSTSADSSEMEQENSFNHQKGVRNVELHHSYDGSDWVETDISEEKEGDGIFVADGAFFKSRRPKMRVVVFVSFLVIGITSCAVLFARNKSSSSAVKHYDVVIIGAGWSGLAAAKYLQSSAIDNFLILEAKDYIGGRSHTLFSFVPGLPIEVGSEFIYGIHEANPVRDLIKNEGLSYALSEYNYTEFAFYSPVERESRSGSALVDTQKASALLDKLWTGDNGFVPFAQGQTNVFKSLWEGGDESVKEVFDRYIEEKNINDDGEKQFMHAMIDNEIETEYAAPLSDISIQHTGKYLGYLEDLYYLAVPGGGYGRAIDALAKSFTERIHLRSRVTRVDYSNEQETVVSVADELTGETRSILASTVLVTVPLGVLKAADIEFVPSLPQSKVDAIESLGYGNLNKCILYWEDEKQAAWPKEKSYLSLITEDNESSGKWTLFHNPMALGNGNTAVLIGWIGGHDADAMEKQTDEEVLADVISNLRSMLGEDKVPRPTKYHVTRWGQDKFSKGALSFPTADVHYGDMVRDLEAHVGNVFFAGEATHKDWYGTTLGAYFSGVTAATQISEYLSDN